MRKLKWTPKQKEIAALLDEGLSEKDIIARGHGRSQVQRVARARREPSQANTLPAGSTRTPPPKPPPGDKPDPIHQTKYRIDSSELVNIGSLQILPEDWRITQHGAFLMLDTYYLTKEELSYEGTMGQFMVDVFRFFRQFMQYTVLKEVGPVLLVQKEVSSDGGEEAGGRTGIPDTGIGEGAEEDERE